MTPKEEKQLKLEIAHIFDSGANEIRVFNMVKQFLEMRSSPLSTNLGMSMQKTAKESRYQDCVDVLQCYMSLTGKYVASEEGQRGWKTNHGYIIKAFKFEMKPTVDEICAIFRLKWKEWEKDTYMKKYMRLPTLFAKKNFTGYWGDLQELLNNPKALEDFQKTNHISESVFSKESEL